MFSGRRSESSSPQSINVEHFRPHSGNKPLKFSWENLFWSCAHCNNIKLDNYGNLLNCTDISDDVENKLKYNFKPFPFEHVSIQELSTDEATLETKTLIEAVFNGTTKLKTIEASNIRDELLKEIQEFQGYLIDYYKITNDDDIKEHYLIKIRQHLHKGSNFTSFKRWIIRDNDALAQEFSQYIV